VSADLRAVRVAADVRFLMDNDSERRGLSQSGKVFLVLFLTLCLIFTWILVVGEGWWLAVPGVVTLGLVAAGIWLKHARKGPFRSLPGGSQR
jgi:Flp pilus assembly protein TadB